MTQKNNLFIFDWDDTLINTTQLFKNNMDMKMKNKLLQIDNNIIQLLKTSMKYGDVIIISNAEYSWINKSSNLYFPKTKRFIENNNITILSAPHVYRSFMKIKDKEHIKWKHLTICYYLSSKQKYDKLISIGDSDVEKTACLNLKDGMMYFNYETPKDIITLKMYYNPSSSKLIIQQNLILNLIKSLSINNNFYNLIINE